MADEISKITMMKEGVEHLQIVLLHYSNVSNSSIISNIKRFILSLNQSVHIISLTNIIILLQKIVMIILFKW